MDDYLSGNGCRIRAVRVTCEWQSKVPSPSRSPFCIDHVGCLFTVERLCRNNSISAPTSIRFLVKVLFCREIFFLWTTCKRRSLEGMKEHVAMAESDYRTT
eukprot:scaffold2983_cov123-Cylindrotheca_fusiformis.AAC.7